MLYSAHSVSSRITVKSYPTLWYLPTWWFQWAVSLEVSPAELSERLVRDGVSEVVLVVRAGSRAVNYVIWSEVSDEKKNDQLAFQWELFDMLKKVIKNQKIKNQKSKNRKPMINQHLLLMRRKMLPEVF